MILFILEGEKTEVSIINTLQKLNFVKDGVIFCYCNNIYDFYKSICEDDYFDGIGNVDTFTKIKGMMNDKNSKLFKVNKEILKIDSSEIQETFLFFDFDIQNKNLSIEEMNKKLEELLSYFNDETENGKLYINYPMVESLKCTNKLLDNNYYSYKVLLADCHNFKTVYLEKNFKVYAMADFLLLNYNAGKQISNSRITTCRNLWILLNNQNIKKLNYICTGLCAIPDTTHKSQLSQEKLFEKQKESLINSSEIYIINSFPLFLFEYYKAPKFLYS